MGRFTNFFWEDLQTIFGKTRRPLLGASSRARCVVGRDPLAAGARGAVRVRTATGHGRQREPVREIFPDEDVRCQREGEMMTRPALFVDGSAAPPPWARRLRERIGPRATEATH